MIPHRPSILALTAAAAALMLACSAPPGGDATGTTTQDIINGVASTTSQNFAVLIVHPLNSDEAYECTGSLLTPSVVLTARHCVSQTADEAFTCDNNGNGSSGGDIMSDFTPDSLLVFTGTTRPPTINEPSSTGAKIFHDSATNLCNHDVALIQLAKPIANPTLAQIRLDTKVTTAEDLTTVGWGVTMDSEAANVRQQRTGVDIINVGPFSSSSGIDVAPNEFDVGESICEGDSGGPALDATSGAVVGLASRGGNGTTPNMNDLAASCETASGATAINFFSQTSPYADLIRQVCAASGQGPWEEGAGNPAQGASFGAACGQDSDCQSGVCSGGSSGGSCVSDCSENTCPADSQCQTLQGGQYCVSNDTPTSGGGGGSKGCALSGASNDNGGGPLVGTGIVLMLVGARRRRTGNVAKGT